MTIDDLAIIIQKGFEDTASKNDLKTGLKQLEERLTAKIEDLEAKVSAQGTSWQQDFDALEGRVSQNETDINALNKVVYKRR